MESLRDEDEVNSSLGLPSPPPAPTSAERGNQAATGAALSVAEKHLFFRDFAKDLGKFFQKNAAMGERDFRVSGRLKNYDSFVGDLIDQLWGKIDEHSCQQG